MAFALYLEHTHRVLLSSFSGGFAWEDIVRCDRAVMLIIGREGPVRGIIDFSDVETVDLRDSRLRERARQPPMAAGHERVFVASRRPALDFAHLFAAMHREFGGVKLHVVGTRAEACKILGVVDPRFEPLELP